MKQPPSTYRTRGFTLMELMVVLVLMGIILSMTTLTVGDGGQARKLEEEARRLVTLIRMSLDEVVLSGKEWEVTIYEDGYAFHEIERKVGDKIEDKGKLIIDRVEVANKIFRKRELPGFKLSVIDKEKLKSVFTEHGEGKDEEEEYVVERLRIGPSGELSPFELKIQPETADDYFIITGNEFGELTLKNAKEL